MTVIRAVALESVHVVVKDQRPEPPRRRINVDAAGTSLGERVRSERVRRGLTQRALAARADIAEWTVIQIELGDRDPKCHTLAVIARALGSSIDALWWGDTTS